MPRILIVEDDPAIRGFLQDALEDEGYAVFTAATGEGALPMLPEVQPDLILIDLFLPGMDGLTLGRRIHASPRFAALPVVFCSAQEAVVIPPDAGHRAILPKPFDLDVLFATLRDLIARPA